MLRIVPAYALCLTICALVIGAAVSTLTAREYFSDPVPWRFVWWNLTFPESMVYVLPGTFEGMPHQAINGSLSTLPGEVRAYALLAMFGLLGLLDRISRLSLALLIAFALVVFAGFQVPLVGVGYFVPMLGYFALGALAWSARGVLPLHGAIALALIGLAVVCRDGRCTAMSSRWRSVMRACGSPTCRAGRSASTVSATIPTAFIFGGSRCSSSCCSGCRRHRPWRSI